MKIMGMVAIAVLAGGSAMAIEKQESGEPSVTVCTRKPPDARAVMLQAQEIAGRIFAEIDVKIAWRPYETCPTDQDGVIRIELIDQSPKGFPSGVMATARPYAHEGVTIQVFRDHLTLTQPRIAAPFLAHVLAHEITHILQGVVRHSENGIMKAHWSNDDYGAMAWKPLIFAPEDVRLIHQMASHAARRIARKTDASTPVEMSKSDMNQ